MFSEVSTWDSWLPAELSCLLCFSFERWVLYLCWNFYFNYWAAPKSCHSRFSKPENKGENRLARTPHMAFVVASHYSLKIIFLLSRAWILLFVRDDRRFLKISSGKGWIQCFIDIRFLTAEWYVVTFWLLCMRKSRLPRQSWHRQRHFYDVF